VDHHEAIKKARTHADTVYAAALRVATSNLPKTIGVARNKAAFHGTLVSSSMTREIAEIYGHHTNELLQAKLNGLLEGCEMYSASIDDQLATDFLSELMGLRSSLIDEAKKAAREMPPRGLETPEYFHKELENNIPLSSHAIRAEIDRRRFMAKKPSATTVYHIEGNNARINVNSTDNSVNVVTTSTKQVFADLRQKLTAGIPSGDEQKAILEQLTALEEAQNSPSFAQRYTEWIALAANHMELIGPFIPALTEMLKKALGA